MKASVRITLLMLALAALSGCAHPIKHETLPFKGLETTPRHFNGILTLPKDNKAPVPVVVLVHGTAGVDSRYAFHRPALLDAGIGTLEVDFKTNVFTSPSDRPPMATFHPWAFGALMALRAHPRVDATRIAIMDSIARDPGKDARRMQKIGPVSFNGMPKRQMTAAGGRWRFCARHSTCEHKCSAAEQQRQRLFF